MSSPVAQKLYSTAASK